MEAKKTKYAPAIVRDLSGVFALRDSNAPGYLSGSKLVDLFNKLGFPDSYIFPKVGIKTSDAEGLSRINYAYKRLTDLNEAYRLPEAVSKLIESSQAAQKIVEDINAVFKRYNVASPLVQMGTYPVIEPVKTGMTEVRPITDAREDMNMDKANTGIQDQKVALAERDEVFDEIPPGVKVAFISYSWDSDEHKEWVLKLSNALIKRGVWALLDQYLPDGYPLTHFMEKGLDRADRVIVVGSPKYLEKSREMTRGGVIYEGNIISSELMMNVATTKFLPVIHAGTFDICLPSKLSTRLGYDFSVESSFDKKVDELVRAIHNVPRCPRPTLGQVPNFTYDDLTEREREDLKDPGSDFRKTQDRKWLDRLLGNFSFDLMHDYLTSYPTYVDGRVFTSFDIWTGMINTPTFRLYNPELSRLLHDFYSLWEETVQVGSSFYSYMPNTGKVKFHGLEHDVFSSKEAKDAYDDIVQHQLRMQPLLKELAGYIQDNFDIDVEVTSRQFIKSLT